jgi:hypothetical protein
MKLNEIFAAVSLAPLVLGVAIACSAGCENKDKVLEVDTPEGEVDVTRDRDTGEIDVDATDEDDKLLDIDTDGADVEINR